MPIAWNEDPPGCEDLIATNVATTLRDMARSARARQTPTVAMAQEWHRRLHRNIALPVPYYAGEIRDSDARFPELAGYEVQVGGLAGVPSGTVPDELEALQRTTQSAVALLDDAIPVGGEPADNGQLLSTITLCAVLHGEWVRIHPFANGNGRTARLWANWTALRYGLPPFVRVKPRPAGDAYALASYASMRREHQVMTGVMLQMLDAQTTP